MHLFSAKLTVVVENTHNFCTVVKFAAKMDSTSESQPLINVNFAI